MLDSLSVDASRCVYCRRDDLSNEASVETFFVSRMLKDLGFQDAQIKPKESIESRRVGHGRKAEHYRPDYVLLANGEPCCIVDAKATDEPLHKWIHQCSGYCLSLNQDYPTGRNPVRYFILSNGESTWLFDWDSSEPLLKLGFADFQWGNPAFEHFKSLVSASALARRGSAQPSPERANDFQFRKPTSEFARQLFSSCHQTIRNTDGIAPGPAFMEFVKVMFVKLWCDRSLRESPDTKPLFEGAGESVTLPRGSVVFSLHWLQQQEKIGAANPVDSLLFSTLRQSIEYDVERRKKKRLFDRDERITLSAETIRRVVAKLEHYDMYGIDEDLNGRLFETFLSATMRGRDLGQFFTPRSIVKMMTRIANLQAVEERQDRVIDACCGSGGFLIEALTVMRNLLRANQSLSDEGRKDLMQTVANHCLFGIDWGKNPPLARIARINMYLHGDGGSRIYQADALDKELQIAPEADPEIAQNVQELKDELKALGCFDLAITNPPFSMTKQVENESDERILRRYALARRNESSDAIRPSLRSSQMFVERYCDLLKEGGRLITVIDDTLLASAVETFKYTREFIRKRFIIKAIISLPGDAFRRQGARVKTSVLVLEKRRRGDHSQPSCYAYFCSCIGVDDLTPRASAADILEARARAEAETAEIVEGYRAFELGLTPPAGFVLPPDRLADRLDLKNCVPQRGRFVSRWEQQGVDVRALKTCVTESAAEVTPGDHPDETFTLIKVSYDGICKVEHVKKGRAIKAKTMYRVRAGQLVFSTIRATDGAVGIVPVELDGALVSGSYTVFDVGPHDYDTAYLWVILRSHEIRADMQSLSPGSGRYTTYWPDVGEILIPWLPEAKRKTIGGDMLEAWRLEKEVSKKREVALNEVAFLGVESEDSVVRWRSSKAPT